MQFSHGLIVLFKKSSVRDSSFALVKLKVKWRGPVVGLTLINGKFISLVVDCDN